MAHKLALGEDIGWSLVVYLHQMDTFCTTGESKLKLELAKPLARVFKVELECFHPLLLGVSIYRMVTYPSFSSFPFTSSHIGPSSF